MKLTNTIQHDTCIVSIFGNLALNETSVVREYVQPLKSQEGFTRVLLNCTGVQIIDSLGIGFLAAFFQDLEESQKRLALCNLNDDCLSVLRSLKLDQIISIYNTEEEAFE